MGEQSRDTQACVRASIQVTWVLRRSIPETKIVLRSWSSALVSQSPNSISKAERRTRILLLTFFLRDSVIRDLPSPTSPSPFAERLRLHEVRRDGRYCRSVRVHADRVHRPLPGK
uniref:Uncharacterized protein n=1 Tax=Steinernema glaseri TaxID=37863 RepID=A0A1I7YZM9_9BILA